MTVEIAIPAIDPSPRPVSSSPSRSVLERAIQLPSKTGTEKELIQNEENGWMTSALSGLQEECSRNNEHSRTREGWFPGDHMLQKPRCVSPNRAKMAPWLTPAYLETKRGPFTPMRERIVSSVPQSRKISDDVASPANVGTEVSAGDQGSSGPHDNALCAPEEVTPAQESPPASKQSSKECSRESSKEGPQNNQIAIEDPNQIAQTMPKEQQPSSEAIVNRKGHRSPSKQSWKRAATRTETMDMVESNSPQFMWRKYLVHFTSDQLNWLSQKFDVLDPVCTGAIPIRDAADISREWIQANHHCANPSPPKQVVNEVVAEVFRNRIPSAPNALSFEHLVSFVDLMEKRVLEADERAGFSEEEVLRLKAAFKVHSKERMAQVPGAKPGPGSRRSSLSTRDTFDVLESLGRDTSTKEAQENVVIIIKEVDVDRTGDLDLKEYLQLVRKVQLSDAVLKRQQEHARIQQSGFSDLEVESYQQLFDFACNSADGSFGLVEFRELFESVSINLDAAERKQLSKMVHDVLQVKKAEEATRLSFGEFLVLIRRMIDQNFAKIRQLLTNRITTECQLDRNHMDSGEADSGWVRRMIEKKNQTRDLIEASGFMESSDSQPQKPDRLALQ